jgi:PiT family inorganic phosphate transporter
MIAAGAFDRHLSFSAAAVVMTLGGLMLARRVADTMSHRIARIDALSGLAANLITAALVLSASAFGLPVSTTHVSVGAIAGAGARAIDWPVLRGVVLSWLATLPLAAGAGWALAAAV